MDGKSDTEARMREILKKQRMWDYCERYLDSFCWALAKIFDAGIPEGSIEACACSDVYVRHECYGIHLFIDDADEGIICVPMTRAEPGAELRMISQLYVHGLYNLDRAISDLHEHLAGYHREAMLRCMSEALES